MVSAEWIPVFISFEVSDMELITDRLILRSFQETDPDDLYEFLSQLENDEFEYVQYPETGMNPEERNHL